MAFHFPTSLTGSRACCAAMALISELLLTAEAQRSALIQLRHSGLGESEVN